MAARETTLSERKADLSKVKESVEDQISERVQKERIKIASDEAKKAKLALEMAITQRIQQLADLKDILSMEMRSLEAPMGAIEGQE